MSQFKSEGLQFVVEQGRADMQAQRMEGESAFCSIQCFNYRGQLHYSFYDTCCSCLNALSKKHPESLIKYLGTHRPNEDDAYNYSLECLEQILYKIYWRQIYPSPNNHP